MKNCLSSFFLLLGTIVLTYTSSAQCNFYSTAVPGITLSCLGGTANRSGVAWNPFDSLYYSVNAGSASYPIETFNKSGTQVFTASQGFSYRGLWWNPTINMLEGNTIGGTGTSNGITNHFLSALGYGSPGGTIILPSAQPNTQSCGDLDTANYEIIYYDNNQIHRYDRTTNASLGTLTITGLPGGTTLNTYGIVYLGCSGNEYGVYDDANGRLMLISASGAYQGAVNIPSPPSAASFKMSFANDLFWLYDGTASMWRSYSLHCSETENQISAEICEGEFYAFGGVLLANPGTYSDTFPTSSCDSIVNLTLKVNEVHDITHMDSICEGDTITLGTQTISTAGQYVEKFNGAGGCDSTITLNVFNIVDNSVTQTGGCLTSAQINANYQWIDCGNGNMAIPGQTNQVFTATSNGSYAVVIEVNGCVDTSNCITLTAAGISAKREEKGVLIFPNPFSQSFQIDLGESNSTADVEVLDALGSVIFRKRIAHLETIEFNDTQSRGIYFVRIRNNKGVETVRLIRN